MSDPDRSHRLRVGAAGATPVTSVPWPLLFRRRVARRLERSPRYGGFVLGVALAGMFSVTMTVTILGVAIKDIASDFGAEESLISWVITGPILAFALVGPALGRAGDILGHRKMFLGSLAGSAFFALLIAISWNAWSLIAFRVLGAAVGAAAGPSAMAMINRVFAPERRVQAMGYWSMVAAGAPVLGVVLGGPIVDHYSWRWIFVFQAPVSVVALLIAALVLPETERDEHVDFDWQGALVLGTTVGLFLAGVNRVAAWGATSPLAIAALVAVVPAGWLFWQLECRAAVPLLPPRYLKLRNVAFPIVAQFFMNFAYMGGFIITPLLLQNEQLFDFTATKAGLYTIARPLTFAIVGPAMGWVAVRIGERTNAVVGTISVVASMLMLSVGATSVSSGWVLAGLALSGFGLGAAGPALAASVANAVDEADFGIAGAAQQMTAQLGVVLGIEVMQSIQNATEESTGIADSFSAAYLVGGGVAVLGIVAAAFVASTPRLPASTATAPV